MKSVSKHAFAKALVEIWPNHDAKKLAVAAAQEISARGWAGELDSVLAAITQALATRGHVVARVTVAHELSEKLEREIKQAIQKQTGATEVELQIKTDPNLIGGFVARAGDFVLDASVRKNLNTLLTYV